MFNVADLAEGMTAEEYNTFIVQLFQLILSLHIQLYPFIVGNGGDGNSGDEEDDDSGDEGDSRNENYVDDTDSGDDYQSFEINAGEDDNDSGRGSSYYSCQLYPFIDGNGGAGDSGDEEDDNSGDEGTLEMKITLTGDDYQSFEINAGEDDNNSGSGSSYYSCRQLYPFNDDNGGDADSGYEEDDDSGDEEDDDSGDEGDSRNENYVDDTDSGDDYQSFEINAGEDDNDSGSGSSYYSCLQLYPFNDGNGGDGDCGDEEDDDSGDEEDDDSGDEGDSRNENYIDDTDSGDDYQSCECNAGEDDNDSGSGSSYYSCQSDFSTTDSSNVSTTDSSNVSTTDSSDVSTS